MIPLSMFDNRKDIVKYGIGGILSVLSFKLICSMCSSQNYAPLEFDCVAVHHDQVLYGQLTRLQSVVKQYDDIGFYRLMSSVDKLCKMTFDIQDQGYADSKQSVQALMLFSDIRNNINRLKESMMGTLCGTKAAHPRDIVDTEDLCRLVLKSCVVHLQSVFNLKG